MTRCTKRGDVVPPDLDEAFRTNPEALAVFEVLPPSHQHEYLDYIVEVKKPEMRARRVAKSIAIIDSRKIYT